MDTPCRAHSCLRSNSFVDIWAFLSAVSKFGLYLGALGSAGLVLNAGLFRAQIEWRSVVRPVLVFAMLGLIASIAGFGLRGAALMGEWSGAFDPEILSILWETPVGVVLGLRVAGFAILLFSALFGAFALWPAGVGVLIVLWSFTQIGHASDIGAIWMQWILLIHLIIAAFWMGILMPLRRLAASASTLKAATRLGHAFGRIAFFAIPILIAAGFAMSVQLVGGPSGMFTAYGFILLAKLTGVGFLLGLGALNKQRFVPRMQMGDHAAANQLVKCLGFECAAFILVLALTALITSTVSLP